MPFPIIGYFVGAGLAALLFGSMGCSNSGGSSRPSDGGGDSGALVSPPIVGSGSPPVRPPNPLVTGLSPTTVERDLGTVPEASSRGDALQTWLNDQLTQSYFDDFRAIYDPDPAQGKQFDRSHAREALVHYYDTILPARLPTLRVTYRTGTTSHTLPNNITSEQLRQAVLARIIREFPDTRPAESAGGAGDAGAPRVGAPIAVPAPSAPRPRTSGSGNGHGTPRPPTGPDIFY